MPKLTERTKLMKDKERIKALETSKSVTEFGYKVADIGKRGGKNLDHIACERGRQVLNSIDFSLLEQLSGTKNHLKNITTILTEVIDLTKNPIQKEKFEQAKWGIEQNLKVGLGGGYTPEKKVTLNANIDLKGLANLNKIANDFQNKLRESAVNNT